MKYIVAMVGIVGIILVGLWAVQRIPIDTTSPRDTDDQTPPEQVSHADTPEGFRWYVDETRGVAMLLPHDATVNEVDAQRVEMTFLGPDNEPQTEITDGFTVTIFADPESTTFATLDTYAQQVIADIRARDMYEIVAEPTRSTVGGHDAYTFEHTTALGKAVTKYIFLPEPRHGYVISHFITDPHNSGYAEMVDTMMSNMSFL